VLTYWVEKTYWGGLRCANPIGAAMDPPSGRDGRTDGTDGRDGTVSCVAGDGCCSLHVELSVGRPFITCWIERSPSIPKWVKAYIVSYISYILYRILCIVYYISYRIYSILYIVYHVLYLMYRILYIVSYIYQFYIVSYILYIIYRILYIIYYIPYLIYGIVCLVSYISNIIYRIL